MSLPIQTFACEVKVIKDSKIRTNGPKVVSRYAHLRIKNIIRHRNRINFHFSNRIFIKKTFWAKQMGEKTAKNANHFTLAANGRSLISWISVKYLHFHIRVRWWLIAKLGRFSHTNSVESPAWTSHGNRCELTVALLVVIFVNWLKMRFICQRIWEKVENVIENSSQFVPIQWRILKKYSSTKLALLW